MPTPAFVQKYGPHPLTSVGDVIAVIPVGNYTHVSIHAADGNGSTRWGAGTPAQVGVKWSNDPTGLTPLDFSSAFNFSGPDTGLGMDNTSNIDVMSVAYIVLVVDVAEANTKGVFHVCAKDNRGA